jgi:hypothetical protein
LKTKNSLHRSKTNRGTNFCARRFIVMSYLLGMTDFFQKEALQCKDLASRARDKSNREYWLRLADRWEKLVQGQQSDVAPAQTELARRERRIYTKSRYRLSRRYVGEQGPNGGRDEIAKAG